MPRNLRLSLINIALAYAALYPFVVLTLHPGRIGSCFAGAGIGILAETTRWPLLPLMCWYYARKRRAQ